MNNGFNLEDLESVDTLKNIYIYKDTELDAWADPFCLEIDEKTLCRSLRDQAIKGKLDPKIAVGQSVYKVGVFHQRSGKIELLDEPLLLMNLSVLFPNKEVA